LTEAKEAVELRSSRGIDIHLLAREPGLDHLWRTADSFLPALPLLGVTPDEP
jgi:hypothetical protein